MHPFQPLRRFGVAAQAALARRRSAIAPRPLVGLLLVGGWAALQLAQVAVSVAVHRPGAWVDAEIAAVILVCAALSSVAGFAFAALAAIGLAALGLDPVAAVHTIVISSIAIQAYAVWQLRGDIRWAALGPMCGGGALAVPCGVWLLLHVQAAPYRMGLGLFLMAYGVIALTGLDKVRVRSDPRLDALAGACAGLVGGLTAFPGALMTVWCALQGGDKVRQRAVYQPFILTMQLITAASLHLMGSASFDSGRDARDVVFALVGAVGGFAVFRRLSGPQFKRVVAVTLMAAGAGLLVAAAAASTRPAAPRAPQAPWSHGHGAG